MPKTSAHKVWESTQQDISPDPEIRQFYQIIEKQLSQEKARTNVQSDALVHEPQNILVVAPHPDDEILCCAQTIQEHLRVGDDVTIVVITNGDGKDETNATESLTYGARRRNESLLAAKKLGIPREKILFLGFPDGHLLDIEQKGSSRSVFTKLVQTMRTSIFPGTPYTWNGLQKSLQKVLEQSQPDIVYLPGQEDTHPDHDVAARAIRVAAKAKEISPQWNEYVVHFQEKTCTAQAVDKEKLELIRVFRSQRHDRFHTAFLEQFAFCKEEFNIASGIAKQ
jgi:LmbE family N-acetylglucosaminyl deacetylase